MKRTYLLRVEAESDLPMVAESREIMSTVRDALANQPSFKGTVIGIEKVNRPTDTIALEDELANG